MVWTQEYQLFVLCDCPGEGSLQKDCCWHLTLKMTTAQGIETSVTNNILASWRLPSPRNLGAGYLTFLLFPLLFFSFFHFFRLCFCHHFLFLLASRIPDTNSFSVSLLFPLPFFLCGSPSGGPVDTKHVFLFPLSILSFFRRRTDAKMCVFTSCSFSLPNLL